MNLSPEEIVEEMETRGLSSGATSKYAKKLAMVNQEMGPRDMLLLLADMFETMGELDHEDIGTTYSNLSEIIGEVVDDELSDEGMG